MIRPRNNSSSMEIKEITNEELWNNWLLKLKPNTFLQSWEWGQVNQAEGQKVRYCGFFKNNQQVGAAQLLTVQAKRGRFLFCPHGPLFVPEISVEEYLPILFRYCQQKARADQAVAVRIAPLLVTNEVHKKIFQKHGFRPAPLHMHTELTWMLDLEPSQEKLLSGMRKTTRHAIKKAQNSGVTVSIETNTAVLDRFWPLYEDTGQRHQFIPFSRSLLKSQFTHFNKHNRIYIAFARYKNQDISAGIFIHFGNTVFYHHGASRNNLNVPAAQLLQWKSIQEAKRRGALHYNFWGIAPQNNLQHPFAGITVFKKGFGGYPIDYLHAQDQPLSLKYWKLWAIEQWRKYKRGF